jgi:hypothetical protein
MQLASVASQLLPKTVGQVQLLVSPHQRQRLVAMMISSINLATSAGSSSCTWWPLRSAIT